MFCCRANAVTFVDLVVENCTFDGTKEAQSVIEVSKCHDQSSPGLVNLRGVAFQKNRLIAASLLRVSASSCSDLEMIDVEIEDNVCSGDGCGVFLGRKTNLENCTAIRNRVVKSNEQMSSLVYAPALSNTTIQGFAASRNELIVVRVQDGVLSLSNASFNQNSPKTKSHQRTNISCIHSVRSSAEIDKCSFTANEGYNGSVILAQESNIFMSGSFFWNNSGFPDGGCVYADYSNVTLENTNATSNSAVHYGGFMFARDSNVTLENTKATNNSAKSFGGFMFARDSNVTLENTKATNNSAKYDGGFMYAHKSNVTLENTKATNNSAKNGGGFMSANKSNVTLENTKATNNTAKDFGGFMYAEKSNVTLENTKATNNSAKYDGGFMLAKYSNVTLENAKATSNSAGYGGVFMFAEYSNVTLENTNATSNSAVHYGGFMYAEKSNVTLENTTATNNSAKNDGGFMYAEKSNVTLENTKATNNSAKYDGGFMLAKYSNVTLENTKATSNSADSGGSVCGKNSALRIFHSHFYWSKAKLSGGFAALESSSIFMSDSEIVHGRAKNGGAIWLKGSNLTTRTLSISHCRADNDGGGVMSFANSTFLCVDCTFEKNSAEKGNGGAVFFDSHPKQNLALRIVQSHIENNVAELGGRTCKK